MRRALAAILPLFLVGCGVDTTGLADDFVEETGDDSSISSDETGLLFDADEASVEDSDASFEDTSIDSSADSAADSLDGAVAETGDETAIEAGADGALDADAEADADLDGSSDAVADGSTDGAIDDTGDAADDTAPDGAADTGLVSAPGLTSCSHSGTAKTCTASSSYCCGTYDILSLSWKWDCAGSCFAARDYKCDEKADCDGGKICCAKTPVFGSNIEGSDCRSSCGGDPQLCMTNAECGGKTCTPQKAPDSPHTIGVCK